jgi:hypothetical protein
VVAHWSTVGAVAHWSRCRSSLKKILHLEDSLEVML